MQELIRDLTQVAPRSKSEVKKKLLLLVGVTQEETKDDFRNMIEKVAKQKTKGHCACYHESLNKLLELINKQV